MAGLSSFPVVFLVGLLLMQTSLCTYWWQGDRTCPLTSNEGLKQSLQSISLSSLHHHFLYRNVKPSSCYMLVDSQKLSIRSFSTSCNSGSAFTHAGRSAGEKCFLSSLDFSLFGLTSAVVVQVAQNCCWGHCENAVNFCSFPRKQDRSKEAARSSSARQ